MKLFRFGPKGRERPGIVDQMGKGRDVSSIVADFDASALGPALLDRLAAIADLADLAEVDLTTERLAAPLRRPGTIYCIGLNYVDHAREAGMPIPDEPVVFSKAASALSGPNDPILWSAEMSKLDWEVELGVVLGRPALRIPPERALDAVFGFTVVNDVSERSWQLERGGQWMKGKSYPSFCPIGPWLVTRDEVADPQKLKLWLSVNGEPRQSGTTASMIFSVAAIVSYLSRFCQLEPGDLICTGTPPGVGAGMKPPIFLKPGDRIAAGIAGLGVQSQAVGAV